MFAHWRLNIEEVDWRDITIEAGRVFAGESVSQSTHTTSNYYKKKNLQKKLLAMQLHNDWSQVTLKISE